MIRDFFRHTFSSLKIRNYRIYFIGQVISVSGTLLQAFAQDWLVLKLTNSGTMLGIVLFFQFFPMLIFSFLGGSIVDKFHKLKILYITQSIPAILALLLGILVLTNTVQIWMVFIFAFLLGLTMTVDNPARQSFIYEMVGGEQIKNAISLWTVLIGLSRIVGPALAGILIATLGMGECFIINAFSYIAVLIALSMINVSELRIATNSQAVNLKESVQYILKTPVIFTTLLMMAFIGTITFEWQATLPLMAKFVFNGNAETYSIISVALSVGMLIGALITAGSQKNSLKIISFVSLFFGLFLLLVSYAPNLIMAVLGFVFVGAFAIAFGNLTASLLQVSSDSRMRGRVMSLWSAGFNGSTAIGGPLIGWVGEVYGARWSLAIGGFAAIIAALYGFYVINKNKNIK